MCCIGRQGGDPAGALAHGGSTEQTRRSHAWVLQTLNRLKVADEQTRLADALGGFVGIL